MQVAAKMKHLKFKEVSYYFQDQASKQIVKQPSSIKNIVNNMIDDKIQILYPREMKKGTQGLISAFPKTDTQRMSVNHLLKPRFKKEYVEP